ncbi:MAG TPA: serine protease [Anaerolineae bacterium]|nr:serine protease [Anaerolineae bacterium]
MQTVIDLYQTIGEKALATIPQLQRELVDEVGKIRPELFSVTALPSKDTSEAKSAHLPAAITLDEQTRNLLHTTLLATYTASDIRRLLRRDFSLSLDRIVQTASLSETLFAVIDHFAKTGQLGTLLNVLSAERPADPRLNKLIRQLQPQGTADNPASGDIIWRGTKGLLPYTTETAASENLLESAIFSKVATAVCRIDTGRGLATGFLIGPRLVMTADFVVPSGTVANVRQAMRFTFDVITKRDGSQTQPTTYKLAERWLQVHDSERRFAILLLDGAAGHDNSSLTNKPRGWLTLPTAPPRHLATPQPIFVAGYPQGGALNIDQGQLLLEHAAQWRYVAYQFAQDIPKRPGTAGAPVVTSEGVLIGMHLLASAQRITLNDRAFTAALAAYFASVDSAETLIRVGSMLHPIGQLPDVQAVLAIDVRPF